MTILNLNTWFDTTKKKKKKKKSILNFLTQETARARPLLVYIEKDKTNP